MAKPKTTQAQEKPQPTPQETQAETQPQVPNTAADPLAALSREELLELVRRAQVVPAAVPVSAAPTDTQALIDALAGAIHASRAVAAPVAPEPLIPVTSTGKSAVTLTLFDPRSNRTRDVNFDERDVTHELTRGEIEHLHTRSPHLFRDGHLSAPDFVPDSVNTIADVDAFVEGLGIDEIEGRVAQITSVGTLFQLYHALEDKRIQTVDETGNPIMVEDESGTARFTVREVPMTPKARLVHSAVVAQLRRRAKSAGGALVR
jgi:hypothetical protein